MRKTLSKSKNQPRITRINANQKQEQKQLRTALFDPGFLIIILDFDFHSRS
jgi:hypothetical protein